MNTGVGDAIDLSWKLSATLQGWGGEKLLASYDTERRPVGWRNVRESSGNLKRMLTPRDNPALLDQSAAGDAVRAETGTSFSAAMQREWNTLGIHLGYRYEDSPVCWQDGTRAPPYDVMTYEPSARPGARAPHVWLDDGRSTLDLFGKMFVLLRLGADAPDPAPLNTAASKSGLPLEVVALQEPAAVAAYENTLVLIRPDGHLAWRGDAFPDDCGALVDRVGGA